MDQLSRRIGDAIQTARVARGLTQLDAAIALGVYPSTVSRWERGSSLPDLLTLPRLAALYGVSVVDLVVDLELAPTGDDL